jgi:uncharacterized membrane protein
MNVRSDDQLGSGTGEPRQARETPEVREEQPIRWSRFQLAVAVLMIAAGVLVYPHLPARIPMHWNMGGEIDRWGDRSIPNVFFQPLIVIAMVLLAWILPRIDPFKRNYTRFAGSYMLIIDLVVGLIALLYAIALYAAFHTSIPIGTIIPICVGLLFALIGNQLSKLKRNFFIGFRTPWALASDAVWTRTHRIGARIFMLAGLGAALSAFLPPPYNFIVFMVLVMGACIAVFAVSYAIHRRLEHEGKLPEKVAEPERG